MLPTSTTNQNFAQVISDEENKENSVKKRPANVVVVAELLTNARKEEEISLEACLKQNVGTTLRSWWYLRIGNNRLQNNASLFIGATLGCRSAVHSQF